MTNPLSAEAAGALAEKHWHVQGAVRALPSYLDRNFLIGDASAGHVLKVAHPSWARQDLDLENRAMLALAEREPDIAWPRVRFTDRGEHLLTLPIGDDDCHVRLLSFVPGRTWADVDPELAPAQRHALEESLGEMVARLTRGLAGFRHPAAQRRHPWNLWQLPDLEPQVAHIDERATREVVSARMQRFQRQLPQWRAQLPMSVVHNDANDHNVIVAEGADGNRHVRSVIDFGDMCTSFRVANLAIACTYAMQHADDAAACAHRVVRGYQRHAPLTRAELTALPELIPARICQSLLMAARAHAGQPDNPYILVSQRGLQALLHTLAELAPEAISGPLPESRHE